jgi:hypothetical protein
MGGIMSSIVVSGDTSGAITVAVPAVAGTNTVTIAAQTGTLNAAGPAFSAYQSSSQTISSTTFTKVQFQTEEFDTANCFDSTTNYRFTPTVAGYYQFTFAYGVNSVACQIIPAIYKNGSRVKRGNDVLTAYTGLASALIYCNGTTDYIEAYVYISTGQAGATGSETTFFQGALVRGT